MAFNCFYSGHSVAFNGFYSGPLVAFNGFYSGHCSQMCQLIRFLEMDRLFEDSLTFRLISLVFSWHIAHVFWNGFVDVHAKRA